MWTTPYVLTTLVAVGLALAVPSPRTTATHDGQIVPAPRGALSAVFGLMTGLILIAVAGARWRVGVDYWNYERLFESLSTTPLDSPGLLDEPGFTLLVRISASIAHDPAIMFALASAITIGLIVWTLYRRANSFAIAIALFMVSGMWQASFNGVRQFIALSILFAGHELIIKRQFVRYSLVVLTASLFHVSALAMIGLYFLPRRRLSIIQIAILLVLALLSLSLYDIFISVTNEVRGEGFLADEGYFANAINPVRIGVIVAPLIIYFFFTQKDQLSTSAYFYVNALFINAALIIAAANSAYVARYALYTNIFVCLGIPALMNMENSRLRHVIYLTTFFLFAIYWYFETRGNSNLMHFTTLWDRPEWAVTSG